LSKQQAFNDLKFFASRLTGVIALAEELRDIGPPPSRCALSPGHR
jgi:hypothetical protein